MNLLIAIPANDYIHFEFTECLTRLIMRLKDDDIKFDVAFQGNTLVYHGRDRLAFKAIKEGYSHVLWLDADMIFTDSLLDDLMFCGKDFVTGVYHARRKPHLSCLFKEIYPGVERIEEYPTAPFKVAGCGFGCVLLKTEILSKVKQNEGTCFFPTRELGEDLAFCKRAKEAGYEIWCEPSVKCGHIGHVHIYPEYRDQYTQQIQGFKEVKACLTK